MAFFVVNFIFFIPKDGKNIFPYYGRLNILTCTRLGSVRTSSEPPREGGREGGREVNDGRVAEVELA